MEAGRAAALHAAGRLLAHTFARVSDDPELKAQLAALRRVEHQQQNTIIHIVLSHVLEEESGIVMDAQRMGGDELERLGAAMQERKGARTRARTRAA